MTAAPTLGGCKEERGVHAPLVSGSYEVLPASQSAWPGCSMLPQALCWDMSVASLSLVSHSLPGLRIRLKWRFSPLRGLTLASHVFPWSLGFLICTMGAMAHLGILGKCQTTQLEEVLDMDVGRG